MKISEARRLYDQFLALHRAEGTRRLYGNRLSLVTGLYENVEDITPERIEEWLGERVSSCAASTLNGDLRILKAWLNWLAGRGHIKSNPLAGLEPLQENDDPRRRALSEDEIKRLIGGRRGLLWEFMVSTGLRKGEFIELRRGDIDLDGGTVTIRRSTVKRSKDRTIPILKGLAGKLDGKFNGTTPDCPAFSNRAGRKWRNNLLRALKSDLRKVGIDGEGVDLHALRKTFATRLIHRGADPRTVQHLLGHASVRLTMEVYSAYIAQSNEATLRALQMPE